MKKFLSILMSMVMVVTMLPRGSFAEENDKENVTNEKQQAKEIKSEKDNVNTDSEGVFKYLQDKFSLLINFVKEKAPQVWEKIKPYVEQCKTWGKDYYKNASEFADKVGKLGLVATVVLSALTAKVVWKVLKYIVALFDDDRPGQTGSCASNSPGSANCKQATMYACPNSGYQQLCSYAG